MVKVSVMELVKKDVQAGIEGLLEADRVGGGGGKSVLGRGRICARCWRVRDTSQEEHHGCKQRCKVSSG